MKNDYINPYRSLRCEGVVGKVPAHFDSHQIFSLGDKSVTVFVGLLEAPDFWDYGYRLFPEKVTKLPGEGSGFFRSSKDALLFALGELRCRYIDDHYVKVAIDNKITDLLSYTMF